MRETTLLLSAYYEALYELLEGKRDLLAAGVEKFLRSEIANRNFGDFDKEKYAAYKDAALAFVDERIEAYNPIGIQYAFNNVKRREVFQMELQLDWYDSSEEFEFLVEAVRSKAEEDMDDARMRQLAGELIKEAGAFPDKSIISGYTAQPAIGKLPDYVTARAIEEIIR